MSVDARMTALCQSVPYLRDREGYGRGWNTRIVFAGECSEAGEYPFPGGWAGSSAAVEAIRFVRHVWNADHRPPSLAYWDGAHLAAYLEWAARPWWC